MPDSNASDQSSKLASILDQLRFERLLAELSARFVNAPAGEVDAAINEALRQIVELTGVDRAQLIDITPRIGESIVTHSWAREGVTTAEKIPLDKLFPWGLQRILAAQPVVMTHVDALPPEAATDRATWEAIGVRSSLALPMKVGGEVVGGMVMGCLREHRDWSPEFIIQTGILAEVLANALAHKRAQEELHAALDFERLLADISTSLLRTPIEGTPTAVERALQAIGEYLQVERTAFWRLGEAELIQTHVWVGAGTGAPSVIAHKGTIRSVFEPISCGRVLNLADVEQLPDDSDKHALASFGTRALLAIPLFNEGRVVGALSIASIRAARHWPESLIPRLALMGESFARVLANRRAADKVHAAEVDAAQHRERLAHMARVHTVGEMSAAIAHEVNQPLVAIENYAQAARRWLAAPGGAAADKLESLLDKIQAQASRAGEVIRRLRAMVKQNDVELRCLDLRRLVADAVRLAEMEIRLTEFRIELEQGPEPLPVMVDEIQLQQVLINLVRNGIDAMAGIASDAKALRVESRCREGGEIAVSVLDTGPGVPAGHEERIFEPFYSTKTNGLGIGLAVCRSIVESHGGRLMYAGAPGGGAAFTFTLPIAEAGEQAS